MNIKILFFLGLLALAGCSKQDSDPVFLQIGIQKDGQPFWDWKGVLMYETKSTGATHIAGAKAHARFWKTSWAGSSAVVAELTIQEKESGDYTITGHIVSPVAVDIELLGTAADEQKPDTVLHFPAGATPIKFNGTLYYTYGKNK